MGIAVFKSQSSLLMDVRPWPSYLTSESLIVGVKYEEAF